MKSFVTFVLFPGKKLWEFEPLQILISPSHHTLVYQNIFPRKQLSFENSKLWATFCTHTWVCLLQLPLRLQGTHSTELTETHSKTGQHLVSQRVRALKNTQMTVETGYLIYLQQISKFWPQLQFWERGEIEMANTMVEEQCGKSVWRSCFAEIKK